MKKDSFIFMFILAVMLSFSACDEHRTITVERLPEAARTLMAVHFPDMTPLVVKHEQNEFEVVFKGGWRIEFDSRGNWKEIDCHVCAVPGGLVPKEIQAKVSELYPGAFIVKMERDRRVYEVKLNNGFGLDFNHSYVLTDLDTD